MRGSMKGRSLNSLSYPGWPQATCLVLSARWRNFNKRRKWSRDKSVECLKASWWSSKQYGDQYVESHQDHLANHPRARPHDFVKWHFSRSELLRFFVLVITTGIVDLPSVKDWSPLTHCQWCDLRWKANSSLLAPFQTYLALHPHFRKMLESTTTVEHTKRAKTVFFTSQAHMYKTMGNTKNIKTFSFKETSCS